MNCKEIGKMKGRLIQMFDRIKILNRSSQSSIKIEEIEEEEEIFEKMPEFLRIDEILKYIDIVSTIHIKAV